jgi:hypothetical protein
MHNDSQRSLDLDSTVLKKIGELRSIRDDLAHKRNREIKYAYSLGTIETRTESSNTPVIEILLVPRNLKAVTMIRHRNSILLDMTPMNGSKLMTNRKH